MIEFDLSELDSQRGIGADEEPVDNKTTDNSESKSSDMVSLQDDDDDDPWIEKTNEFMESLEA